MLVIKGFVHCYMYCLQPTATTAAPGQACPDTALSTSVQAALGTIAPVITVFL